MTKQEQEQRFGQLHEMVSAGFERALAAKEDIERTWLVHKIVSKLEPPKGGDADVYRLTAYYTIGDLVSRKIRSLEKEERGEAESRQLAMPGYARLQSHYALRRTSEGGEEETVFVHIDNASDEELSKKCDVLHSQSDGLLEHERELRDYIRARRRGARRA